MEICIFLKQVPTAPRAQRKADIREAALARNRLNPGKAQKLHNAPLKHCKPWKQLYELHPGISQGFTAHCHSPALSFPLVLNPSPKRSCSDPGQPQPPSTCQGLEWASCKSRSAAFSLPRDRKAAHSANSSTAFSLGKGTVPLTALQGRFESVLARCSKPWPA